jgi:hypothetical protein
LTISFSFFSFGLLVFLICLTSEMTPGLSSVFFTLLTVLSEILGLIFLFATTTTSGFLVSISPLVVYLEDLEFDRA